MINKFNQSHIVTLSPWPILSSTHIYSLIIQIVVNNRNKTNKRIDLIYIATLSLIPIAWWKNTIFEANKEGLHTKKTTNRIKKRIILFIVSEILFFIRFFWAFFHSGIRPRIEIGIIWPPTEIKPFNPINVPLLNTIILIRSGFSITWSHHAIIKKNLIKSNKSLLVTILLGSYFTILQGIEHIQSEFSLADSCFGTIFFIATGFHGLHVLIGSTFLVVNYLFLVKIILSYRHHTGFEIAAWYWHFVDVVWLFLYLSIYWWRW